jgi:hypothetical protein
MLNRTGDGEKREERKKNWSIGMLQKYYILSMCTLVPREEFDLRNWMGYFVEPDQPSQIACPTH